VFCLCYLFIYFIYNDFCQTDYLSIYRTDLHHNLHDSRTVAVDGRLKLLFRLLKGGCRGNQFLLVLSASIYRIWFAWHSSCENKWRQANANYAFVSTLLDGASTK